MSGICFLISSLSSPDKWQISPFLWGRRLRLSRFTYAGLEGECHAEGAACTKVQNSKKPGRSEDMKVRAEQRPVLLAELAHPGSLGSG